MNKIKNTLLLALMFVATITFAQKEVGMATYKVTDVSSDNPQMAAQLGMLKSGSMEIYENDNKVLFVQNMAGMMETKILTDKETKNQAMYMDMMGQKVSTKMTAEDLEKQKEDATQPTMIVDKDVTKEILGYDTYKVSITAATPQGNVVTTLFVTEDLEASGSDNMLQNADVKIEGFPLEMTTEMAGQFTMTYTASEVKMRNEISDDVFNIDESQYSEKTAEEMKEMFGGMGGM